MSELNCDVEPVVNFLAHYGVKGMKWGVRKGKRGQIRPRATLHKKDLKDTNWLDSGKNHPESYNEAYHKTYKKAAPKIRQGIRTVNANPKFRKKDFRKASPIRREYYAKISESMTRELNSAATRKGGSENGRFELNFKIDVENQAKPTVTVRHRQSRKGRRDTRKNSRTDRSQARKELSTDKKEFRTARKAAATAKKASAAETKAAKAEAAAAARRARARHSLEDFLGEYLIHVDDDIVTDIVTLDVIMNEMGYIVDIDFESGEEDSLEQSHEDAENFLAHYGVKGMKWGVRRNRDNSGGSSKKPSRRERVKELRKKKSEPTTPSEDYVRTQKIKQKKVAEMSNAELRAAIDRMNLEKNYANLTPKQTNRGLDFAMKTLSTAQKVSTTYDTVKGLQGSNAVKDVTKLLAKASK